MIPVTHSYLINIGLSSACSFKYVDEADEKNSRMSTLPGTPSSVKQRTEVWTFSKSDEGNHNTWSCLRYGL